ncbi:hypothetical protein [Bacillus salipaludis]|nr:hypothetical protein [Bacillus salipaludis]
MKLKGTIESGCCTKNRFEPFRKRQLLFGSLSGRNYEVSSRGNTTFI